VQSGGLDAAWKKWRPRGQGDRGDRNLDPIQGAGIEELAGEIAAADNPDVAAGGRRADGRQRLRDLSSDKPHVGSGWARKLAVVNTNIGRSP
jgi:hypothetical protein